MAQTSVIDSLERVLASGVNVKSEKAELLVQLSQACLYVDSAKSRSYAMEALQTAQNSGAKMVQAKAYSALGNFYSVFRMPYPAHEHHIKAEKIYLELDDKEQLYKHYYNMMTSFYDYGEYDNTVYYANKVLPMATERKAWNTALTAQYMIGITRYRNKFGQEPLDYFLNLYRRASYLDDSLNVTQNITITLAGRCARDYTRGLKQPDKALPYLHKIRLSYIKNERKPFFIFIYNELAEAHLMMNNVDSAEYYLRKAFNSERTTNFLPRTYFTSAKIDSIKGNYLSALSHYQKYHHITDSLAKEDASTEKARLRVWHEFDQKDLEQKLLQQKFQRERKLTIILIIALVLIFALFALLGFFHGKIREKNHELKELHTVKDKLFSVVAHDLRGPVSALVSILKLVDANQLNAKEQAQLFKDVSSRVDSTYYLLENLLRWAKSQLQGLVTAPVFFDVLQETRLVVEGLQNTADQKKIDLENRIRQQQVYADLDMFSVVVRNLIANAIKFTFPGGKVQLSCELSGNLLVISVQDNGMGMTQEVQKKLFNLSETKSQHGTDNENGAGLGLVMCAEIVKANGGSIWFTSVKGEGSTFFFSVLVKK